MPEEKAEYIAGPVCPLRMHAYETRITNCGTADEPDVQEGIECLEPRCAWWDLADDRCGILSICYEIATVCENLPS